MKISNRTIVLCVCGTITRCEWQSVGGVYKSHHQYDTKYPSNAKRGA